LRISVAELAEKKAVEKIQHFFLEHPGPNTTGKQSVSPPYGKEKKKEGANFLAEFTTLKKTLPETIAITSFKERI